MIPLEPLLVTLVKLVDSIPGPQSRLNGPEGGRKYTQTACFSRR